MSILQHETTSTSPATDAAATPPAPRRPGWKERLRSFNGGPLVFHRPRRRSVPRPVHCLNCGDLLTGNYCANCGQAAVDERTALWPLVSDVLSEFARWDSKFVRTLLPLLFRPGFLTNEYNAGRRASYLAPFRLFLSVSVLFFLFLSWQTAQVRFVHISSHTSSASLVKAINQQTQASRAEAKESLSELNNSLQEAKSELPPAIASHVKIQPISASNASNYGTVVITSSDDSSLKQAWETLPLLPMATPQQMQWARSTTDWSKTPLLFPHGVHANGIVFGQRLDLKHLPTTPQLYDALQSNPAYPYHDRPLAQKLIHQLYRFGRDHSLFATDAYDIAPKLAIILVPLFAMIMYPLYLRRRRYYVDHLVFALHNHTFLFMIAALAMVVPQWLGIVLASCIPLYMFVAMKVVYQQHWLKTLAKFSVVGFTYIILITIIVSLGAAAELLLG